MELESSFLNNMDTFRALIALLSVSDWYGICFIGLFVTHVTMRLALVAMRWSVKMFSPAFKRYVLRSRVWNRRSVTVLEATLLLIYLGVNGFFLGFRIGSIKELSSRAGKLAILNMLPLLTGTRLAMSADLLGCSTRTQFVLHKWLSMTATFEALLHSLLVFFPVSWVDSRVYGTVVCQVFPHDEWTKPA